MAGEAHMASIPTAVHIRKPVAEADDAVDTIVSLLCRFLGREQCTNVQLDQPV
jgi:hypothetical protein